MNTKNPQITNGIWIGILVTIVVGVFLLAVAGSGDPILADSGTPTPSPSCSPPGTLAPGQGIGKDTPVTVHINSNSGQFSSADFNCLKTAFTNWNTVNQSNGSGVVFTVSYSSQVIATTNPPGVFGKGVKV